MADRANLSISHHRYFKTLAVSGWLWFDLGESPELKLDQLLPLKDRAGPGEVEAAGEQGMELPCSGHVVLQPAPSSLLLPISGRAGMTSPLCLQHGSRWPGPGHRDAPRAYLTHRESATVGSRS